MSAELEKRWAEFAAFISRVEIYYQGQKGQQSYMKGILRSDDRLRPRWNDSTDNDTGQPAPTPNEHPNITAIKHAIAYCEGTDMVLDSEASGYDVIYSYAQPPADISPGSDHPRRSQPFGNSSSDAAGRYQFMSFTWDEYSQGSDFSPTGQEETCDRLLYEKRHVGRLIEDGLFNSALWGLSLEWASICVGPLYLGKMLQSGAIARSPNDGQYGQPTHPYEQLRGYYLAMGGVIND